MLLWERVWEPATDFVAPTLLCIRPTMIGMVGNDILPRQPNECDERRWANALRGLGVRGALHKLETVGKAPTAKVDYIGAHEPWPTRKFVEDRIAEQSERSMAREHVHIVLAFVAAAAAVIAAIAGGSDRRCMG